MNAERQLLRLVKAGQRFRRTPIVDDDFPALRDDFDCTLQQAEDWLTRPRPKIVCLCGSTRFAEAYREANLRETLAGHIVLSVGCDTKSDQWVGLTEADKARLDELHLRKIDLCDEVLVLNCLRPWCHKCGQWCKVFVNYADGADGKSTCCFVLPRKRPYIGESTRREIDYACAHGKPVRYLEPVENDP